MANTSVDAVFNQYLNIVSFGNVSVEQTFGTTGRCCFRCGKCLATLTYSDVSLKLMSTKYTHEAVLDQKVKDFCKVHRHQVKHEKATMYPILHMSSLTNMITTNTEVPPMPPYNALIPAREIKLSLPLPIKKLGRKIR